VHIRVLPALLAVSLMAYPATESLAAAIPVQQVVPAPPAPPAPAQSMSTWEWPPPPQLLAQGVGALIGFGAFSLFLAPQAATATGPLSFLGNRIMATVMAATGAVAGTYAYDLWAGLPTDYAYFWHRGGFVAGVAAGVALFGVLGYPAGGGTTWFGWAANRVTLVGAGLYGAWVTDHWYTGR
jgi:hypothetical protein